MLVVGLVTSCELIPNKDKLKDLLVDVGLDEPIQIVTNAPNITLHSRTIIALVDHELDINGETIIVKKSIVGGRPSHGMVCDSKMCGWVGGAEGIAVQIPESFPVGSECPSSRPRMDGGGQTQSQPEELSIKDKKALEKAAKKAAAKEKKRSKEGC
ncbi:hypothetical protein BC833DRAFT_588437 [Globomyces pollinis-pini]|nr:hypothetical protein BC833DRAFT_588437 [Globomyces pollinis-pini]